MPLHFCICSLTQHAALQQAVQAAAEQFLWQQALLHPGVSCPESNARLPTATSLPASHLLCAGADQPAQQYRAGQAAAARGGACGRGRQAGGDADAVCPAQQCSGVRRCNVLQCPGVAPYNVLGCGLTVLGEEALWACLRTSLCEIEAGSVLRLEVMLLYLCISCRSPSDICSCLHGCC